MVLRARRARRQAGGRWRGERAASEWRSEGSGGALCLPLCFCFFLGLRRLLVSSTEKRRRKNTQRRPEEGGAHLPRTWRLIVMLLSLLVRSVAWVRRLPLCYRAAIVSQISELGYLTVQSKWSDEHQQSSKAPIALATPNALRCSSPTSPTSPTSSLLSLVCEWACVCRLQPRLLRNRFIAPRECLRSVG